MLLLKNALINDAINPIPYKADILIDDLKIKQISNNIEVNEAVQIIDLWFECLSRVC